MLTKIIKLEKDLKHLKEEIEKEREWIQITLKHKNSYAAYVVKDAIYDSKEQIRIYKKEITRIEDKIGRIKVWQNKKK